MKHAFVVTSSIQVDADAPKFKGTASRSYFDTKSRLNQTLATLLNLRILDPRAEIILLESSPTRFNEIDQIDGIRYIEIHKLNQSLGELLNTHSSKSYCEAMMFLFLFSVFESYLKQFDYITKISGRYLLDNTFHLNLLNEENTDKFIFKNNKKLIHPVDNLFSGFRAVLPPEVIIQGTLFGQWTVLYSIGKNKLNIWHLIMKLVAENCDVNSKYFNIDIEYLIHYYLNKFDIANSILYSDTNFYGWQGNGGIFEKY